MIHIYTLSNYKILYKNIEKSNILSVNYEVKYTT